MNRSESRYFATAARMDEAFLTLLAKKDFEYITVKEICEVAEVNRSTFYLHYETMSDFHYICYRCDSAVCKNATKRNNEVLVCGYRKYPPGHHGREGFVHLWDYPSISMFSPDLSSTVKWSSQTMIRSSQRFTRASSKASRCAGCCFMK